MVLVGDRVLAARLPWLRDALLWQSQPDIFALSSRRRTIDSARAIGGRHCGGRDSQVPGDRPCLPVGCFDASPHLYANSRRKFQTQIPAQLPPIKRDPTGAIANEFHKPGLGVFSTMGSIK
jgi:hypothetical protein